MRCTQRPVRVIANVGHLKHCDHERDNMNETAWGAIVLSALIACLWGGSIYGRSTKQPLWGVFVIAVIALEAIVVVIFGITDPWPPEPEALVVYAVSSLPFIFWFGLFSYGMARRGRRLQDRESS
jgi:hypothetical protein